MKIRAAVVISAVAFGLMGCSPKHSIKTVLLEMRSHDEFALDGRIVRSGELRTALHALTNAENKVCITVSSAKPIPYDEVRALMHEIQNVGISCVGSVGVDS